MLFFLFSQKCIASEPENDNTSEKQHIALSDDPIPGPSRISADIDNDNISEISDLYDSDDSVADSDFSVSDLFNNKYVTTIESDDDLTELINFIETPQPTIRSILPKSNESKLDESIFIATYPNSIIFKNQQQAVSFNSPQTSIKRID